MATALRKTGISIVGNMPWGTHFCHFHETKEDLLDTFFAPFSPTALAFLQQSLAYQQHRRRVYRARRLQVYLDGEERWQYDPRVGVCEPFLVPLSASSPELFGDDAEGPLLLAVFPLLEPEVAEADGALHLSVTLEGGLTVALAISLGEGTGGEEHAYVMQLTYTESAMVDRQGAEPPAVDALPAVPRPEPSTPWSAACATPPRPGLGAARAPGGARTPRL